MQRQQKLKAGQAIRSSQRGFTMIEIMIVLAVIAIVALIAIPNLLASKTATDEAATCGCLKAFLTSQFQFYKKKDYFSPNAQELLKLNLVAGDSAGAFQPYNDNGDSALAPKAGYWYRVLQGDGVSNTSWFIDGITGPNGKLVTWAATSRAAEPYGTGDNQFFISEAGSIYRKAEPKMGQPGHKAFLLDALPPIPPSTWNAAR